jgi:hypothetical protein
MMKYRKFVNTVDFGASALLLIPVAAVANSIFKMNQWP